MKCNCFSRNKYEIIGLCDIQKFNEKINEFTDKSWSQVSISDNLILSGDKPSIKTITKTFISIKITSTKLINSPKSTTSNVEGINLTGKLLLVSGEIIQRILYTSNNSINDKINSFKIKSPFTTYIIVDENVDIDNDKFCVYHCIEYTNIRVVNETTLNQTVTLFLFAHKVTPSIVPIPIFPNEIILRNQNDNEILKIEFDLDTNKLKVTSTGTTTPNTFAGRDYFKVKLYNVNPRGEVEGVIEGNQDGSAIVTALNGKDFSFGDVIDIICEEPHRVLITNYPNEGDDYNLTDGLERFRIANIGLVKIDILPDYENEIVLRNQSGNDLAIISFDTVTSTLMINSTGDNNDATRIRIELYQRDGTTLNAFGEIAPNSTGTQLATSLDGKRFKVGHILNIIYEDKPNKILITNFPNGSSNYNPKFDTNEAFIINIDKLSSYVLLEKIQSTYYNNSTRRRENIIELYFSKFKNQLRVISTGNRAPFAPGSTPYFSILLTRTDGSQLHSKINNNRDGSIFKQEIDTKNFSTGDILEVISQDTFNTKLVDLDTGAVSDLGIIERYEITDTGLQNIGPRPVYPNDVIFLNDDRNELARVRFTLSTMKLFVTTTDNIIQEARKPVLQFRLYNSTGTTLKGNGVILTNTNAQEFVNTLNGVSFVFGDIIVIGYGNFPNRVNISDYPSQWSYYTPQFTSNESFIVTPTGLEPYLLQNSISLISSRNQTIVSVQFDKLGKNLKIISGIATTPSQFSGRDYFRIVLRKANGTSFTGRIQGNQDGTAFKTSLDNKTYSLGDTLEIFCLEANRIVISNLPDLGDVYIPTQQTEEFRIGEDKLTKI